MCDCTEEGKWGQKERQIRKRVRSVIIYDAAKQRIRQGECGAISAIIRCNSSNHKNVDNTAITMQTNGGHDTISPTSDDSISADGIE